MGLNRSLNILDYALSMLLRRKMKNTAVLLVFSLVIFLLASFQLIASALRTSADVMLTTVPDITVQMMSAGRQVPLSITSVRDLESIFGIARIRLRVWGYYFDEKNGANYTVVGMESDEVDESMLEVLAWGILPRKFGEVVVAPAVAQSIQLNGRKQFSLFRPDLSLQSFKVVGEFAPESGLVTADTLFMRLEDARELFGMADGYVTDVLVDSGNAAEIETIARKIADRLPASRVITKKQIRKTYDVVFSWRSGVGSICLLASLFAFIILAWDKASGLSPEEKREMAILKIAGWQTRDILVLRFWEGTIVSILAFLFGYSSAWFHVGLFDGALLRPILLGWSVLRPSYTLLPPFSSMDVLLIATLSILPYLAATIIPAWRSSMVRPDSVI